MGKHNAVVSTEAQTAQPDRELLARVGGFLYAAAGTVTLLSLMLPHEGFDVSVVGIVGCALAAWGLAAALLTTGARMPLWAHHASVLCATLLVGATIYLSGGITTFAQFYVWVSVYVFYFFTARVAALHLTVAALSFLVVLRYTSESAPELRWFVTAGTFAGAGLIMGALASRDRHSIRELTGAATTDMLTGLLNRRGFEKAFARELERARRSQQPLAVLIADIDHFKLVNDNFGHEVGDEVLRTFGRVLRETARDVDAVARYGGEEFAIVAPDTAGDGSYALAQRVRDALADALEGDPWAVTVSVGIATYPKHGRQARDLVEAADQALYYGAKRLGRDCAVVYSAALAELFLGAASNLDAAAQLDIATGLSLAEELDLRDTGSVAHVRGVGRAAEMIGRELGFPDEKVQRLRLAGLMHDVGKIRIPHELRVRRGPLSYDEWERMKQHPVMAAQILTEDALADIRDWVCAHHERFEGGGYPEGVDSRELPVESRILAVAEAYATMVYPQAYRDPVPEPQARAELRRCAGSQFDPGVVHALLHALEHEDPTLETVPRWRGQP